MLSSKFGGERFSFIYLSIHLFEDIFLKFLFTVCKVISKIKLKSENIKLCLFYLLNPIIRSAGLSLGFINNVSILYYTIYLFHLFTENIVTDVGLDKCDILFHEYNEDFISLQNKTKVSWRNWKFNERAGYKNRQWIKTEFLILTNIVISEKFQHLYLVFPSNNFLPLILSLVSRKG